MNNQERRIAAAMMHALDGVDLLELSPDDGAGWHAEIDWNEILGRTSDGDLMLSGPGARTISIHFDVKIVSDDQLGHPMVSGEPERVSPGR